jgi:hypothetical protein
MKDEEKEDLRREYAEPRRKNYYCRDRMCGATDCRRRHPGISERPENEQLTEENEQ